MGNVCEIAASLIECFIVVRFFGRWLSLKWEKNKYYIYGTLFVLLALDNVVLSQKEGFENFSVVALLLLLFAYALIFQQGKIYEKILEALVPALTVLPINIIVLYSMSIITDESTEVLRHAGGSLRFLVLFFTKFLFFLVCEILILLKRKEAQELLSFQWLLQLICFVISFLIANTVWNIFRKSESDSYGVLFVSMLIAVLNIVLFVLLNKMENSNRLREQYRMAQMNLDYQKEFVQAAQRRYQEIKTLQHDMKHCLTTAVGLISSERPEKAKAYLEELLKTKTNSFENTVYTGCSSIDSVLNEKIAACRAQSIDVKCVINREFGKINEIDMGVLLANLLDNAIRGSEATESPEVILEISRKKSYLVICVKNKTQESVLLKNPELETTKRDKSAHGYGIASIRDSSRKYDGQVNFYEEGGFFYTEVWLNAEKGENLK